MSTNVQWQGWACLLFGGLLPQLGLAKKMVDMEEQQREEGKKPMKKGKDTGWCCDAVSYAAALGTFIPSHSATVEVLHLLLIPASC